MFVNNLFSRTLAACFALCLFASGIAAQTDSTRPRQVAETTQADGSSRLENDVFVVSEAEMPATAPVVDLARPTLIAPHLFQFNRMMLAAIDTRIGAPYVYGATGPRVYDCSGFVWSVFQSSGINFERSNARTFWSTFLPATEDEKHKFGTLVFFNNLKHVGIVAGDGGFYHASTSQGVTYSPFNEYWTSRVTGYRRVPMPASTLAD